MYSNAALRLYPKVPANTDFVDRGLNVAYERIRDIHNHLDDIEYVKDNITDISKLYKYFKEGIGDYDGITDSRFLGEVGVDDPSLKTVPPLIQLAHAVSDMKLLSAKVEDIYRVSSKIKHIIEVSYKLPQVETVAENIQALLNIHKHIVELLKIHSHIVQLISIADDLETLDEIALHLNKIDTVSEHIEQIDSVSEYVNQIDTLYKDIDKVLRVQQSIKGIDRIYESIDNIDSIYSRINKIDAIDSNLVAIQAIYNNLDKIGQVSVKLEPVIGLSKLPDSSFALEKGVQYVVLDELESDEEKFSYWGSIKNIVLDTYPGSKILPNNTTTIFMDGTESQVFPEDYTPVNPDTSIHINDPDYTDPTWSINIIPNEDDIDGEIIPLDNNNISTNPSENEGEGIENNNNTSDDNTQGNTNPSSSSNSDTPSVSGGTMIEDEESDFDF